MEELQWAARAVERRREKPRREGRNDSPGARETHSGISPLALPISGVLHWPPQPSCKRYRINVSLITYTASARTPTLSCETLPRFCVSLDYPSPPFHPFLPPTSRHLSRHGIIRRHVLKKQTFIRTKKAAIVRR